MTSATDQTTPLPLDMSKVERETLATYGFTVGETPRVDKNPWGERVLTLYPLTMTGETTDLLWYRADDRRYTYWWHARQMGASSTAYDKAYRRNGDQANFELSRFLRDSDRLLVTTNLPLADVRPLFAQALTYYLTWNTRTIAINAVPARTFADCVQLAAHPAVDKSALKPLWNKRVPTDMLLLVLQGMHPSLILEFADLGKKQR